jgi:DNA-binding transcriptional MerR regulator
VRDETSVSSPSDFQLEESPDTTGQHLYVMESQGLFKIGRSSDVLRRERQLSGALGSHHLVQVFENEVSLEIHLHRLLQQKRVQGEYFDCSLDEIREALRKAQQGLEERRAKRRRLAEDGSFEERLAALEQQKAKLATKETRLAKKQAQLAKEQADVARMVAELRSSHDLQC